MMKKIKFIFIGVLLFTIGSYSNSAESLQPRHGDVITTDN